VPIHSEQERRSQSRSNLLSDRVVAHFLAGKTLEGKLILFDPVNGNLTLRIDSKKQRLECSDLKAIFFLRRPTSSPLPESWLKPGGKKISVTFADGEKITGYCYGLQPFQKGFYFFPVHAAGRNERICVIRKNTFRIETEEK